MPETLTQENQEIIRIFQNLSKDSKYAATKYMEYLAHEEAENQAAINDYDKAQAENDGSWMSAKDLRAKYGI
ncbi:MAG: hypothetical protein FWB98_07515 [Defluviitaleaceae bacterium]|nr:hypothetical protein [Defluviitaleaceae bacterium]